MSVAYLHGVEFLPVEAGVRPVKTILSSVILLVGTAPKGDRQKLILVQKPSDITQFGKEVPGFTITKALNAIYASQPCTVLVVNVYDSATNVATVTKETVTIASGKGKLAYCPIGALTTLYQSDGTTVITAVVGTDYTVDDFGNIVVLNNTTIPDGTIKVTYKKADLSGIDADAIIGDDGPPKTGMQLAKEAYATFGFKPKQIITPGYSNLTAVEAAMAVLANSMKAVYYVDAPNSTEVADAISSRGPAGPVDAFNTSDKRGILLYPNVKAYDAYTDADEVRPYSQYFAGLVALVDNLFGYWVSPSNNVIAGITGVESPITWDFTDQTGATDANNLNAAGIVTLASGYGTGIRAWGNRNASYPSNTDIDNFIPVQRVRDMLEDSIALTMLPFADKPITVALMDSILETINQFMRTLVARGALVEGSNCTLDPNENTDVTLAAGQIIFLIDFAAPTPGERFTFNSFLDIKLLSNILAAAKQN